DYCDVYLTHDSMSVRKAHNSGRNHLRNVQAYYEQISSEKAQSVIDSITASYADAGQQNPMQNAMPPQQMGAPGGFPPFGFPPPGNTHGSYGYGNSYGRGSILGYVSRE
ncbi:zf-U1-domain-containing protein, partial [Zopfia rhizophila CBS 207.26]